MQTKFLGRVHYSAALELQDEVVKQIRQGQPGQIIGFESEPVITLGRRAQATDLLIDEDNLVQSGFSSLRVDRGGQATLHNPGQLVIFPVLRFAPLVPRDWVCRLSQVTKLWLEGMDCSTVWDEARPGLYSGCGKVMAMGLRFQQGISTHGLAINVHNDLAPFSWIVPCGSKGAGVDRLKTNLSLEALFASWCDSFCKLTTQPISTNLCGSVRL